MYLAHCSSTMLIMSFLISYVVYFHLRDLFDISPVLIESCTLPNLCLLSALCTKST